MKQMAKNNDGNRSTINDNSDSEISQENYVWVGQQKITGNVLP